MGSPFVGRAAERALLSAALDDAQAGRGGLVLVGGEPGIGKTTLVDALAKSAEAAGFAVAFGRAWERGGAPPWWIWTDALRTVDAPLVLPRTLANDEARFACFEEIARRIRILAAKTPLLLVLDDLHNADASSLLALALVARTMRRLRLLVVATLREPHEHTAETAAILADIRRDATSIRLEGLSLADLVSLAASRGVAAAGAAVTLRLTRGNPLFATELLGDGAARAALAEGREPPIGHGARAVLGRHLEGLPADARATVEWAAVCGDPIDVGLVAAASGRASTEIVDHVDAARKRGVLGADGFAHAVFRAATYDMIPNARRSEMHAAIARALAVRSGVATRVAIHLHEADPLSPASASAARSAAREAIDALAYEEAVVFAERAVTVEAAIGSTAALADALCLLAEARVLAGDVAGSAVVAERALAVARSVADPIAFARAALALGLRRVMAVSSAPLVARLDEALAGLEGSNEVALHCAVEARLAAALQPMVDPPRALALARSSIGRARDSGDRALLARTLHAARPAFRLLEPFAERRAIDRETLGLAEALGDDHLAAHAHGRLFWDAIEGGDRVGAEVALAEYERLAGTLRLAHHELGAASARIVADVIGGRWADATVRLDALERTRPQWASATAMAQPIDPVLLMRTMGPLTAALITEVCATMVPVMRPVFDLFLRARAGLDDGTRETCAAIPAQVLAGEQVPMMVRSCLGDAAVRLREPTHAARLFVLLAPYSGLHAVGVPMSMYLGSIDRMLAGLTALTGDRSGADRYYESAIAQEEALGAATFADQTRRERAALLGAVARRRPASKLLPELVHEGETWRVAFGAEHARLKDGDGLRYIAYLLARPDVPVPVIELFAARTGAPAAATGDAGDVLDREAIAAYRARAREIEELIESNAGGDTEPAHRELEHIEAELRAAVGLGGRSRRAASDVERIRVNVTTRIKKTIDRVREHAPALAHHLETTIRTGTVCVYRSPP